MVKVLDVLVIGAGQAGLAMGYYLNQTRLSFLLTDSFDRLGSSWRRRYDSLILFSPRSYSSLPGLLLSGDPEGFPSKNEIADYLEGYASYFSLPVSLSTHVERLLTRDDNYIAVTRNGNIEARNIIVATGPFHKPYIPEVDGKVSNHIFQLHSSLYLRPSQIPEGPVLIVGAGNSGAQIAAELAKTRKVFLSIGHKISFVPTRILGRSLFWWLDKLGVLRVNVNSWLGKFLQRKEPVIGIELKSLIKKGKVNVVGRLASIDGDEAEFSDGSKIKINSVIWATGFKTDYNWIQVDGLLHSYGRVIHERGISLIPGLYFLGLPWLHRRGSAQLGGVGYDAKFLCNHLLNRSKS
jgi:putative flavoprotein involved in K+ transport